jgi:hypothetical protein
VVIRPPEAIPGLAEISVRVAAPGVEKVTALPIKWNAGRKGAPPADVAQPVRGETNLYSAELWFMESGAQSVELEVTGAAGVGRATVPVDAMAQRVLSMPKGLGAILVVLGLALVALLSSIIGAAVRESMLEPGARPTSRGIWRARGAIAAVALLLAFLLWGGKRWWDAEAGDYRDNRLYKPMAAAASILPQDAAQILRFEITDERFARSSPLVPDHGKLMHLFLVREPKLDAFAHLHPTKRDRKTFETVLPDLPAGSYRIYADATYETGFSDTFTCAVTLPDRPAGENNQPGAASPADPDDSWRVDSLSDANTANTECRLDSNLTMVRTTPDSLVPNQPVRLQFAIRNSNGQPAALEPYLGMRGHLALRRDDGSVFTHLHPGGTPSMAAIQLSVLRAEGKLPLEVKFGADDPKCELPALSTSEEEWLRGTASLNAASVTFPYAFPKPGRYRVWVQVKVSGRVLTGVYDVDVHAPNQS